MKLCRALGLEEARLVSLCGAGGKTSLMFALAREFAAAGDRVLITTTTKIATDEAAGPWPVIAAADAEAVLELARGAAADVIIAYDEETSGGTRLKGFSPETVDALHRAAYFDRILVEADGSARRPLKAPAPHEPVIPPATDAVVMVAGLIGLDLPLAEANLFRPEIWAALTGAVAGAPVSAESLARIIVHPQGSGKGIPSRAARILFLNRADDWHRLAQARHVIKLLSAAPRGRPDRAVAGWLLPEPEIAEMVVFRGRQSGA